MTDDRVNRIEQAIAEAEAHGVPWTNESIRAAVGGNKTALGAYLKDRRARSTPSGAVAVLEPQSPLPSPVAPPLPPAPTPPLSTCSPDSPLAMARTARDVTRRTEQVLAEQHSTLKRQRQEVEQRLLVLETTRASAPEALELARRRETRALHTEHAQVEAERQRCFALLALANQRRLTTADAYQEVQAQAGRWLHRMRQRQRESRTMPHAWARADATEEAQSAAEALAQVIGEDAARALAADPTLQPDWLTD